jgi:hypothetical protein
MAESSEKDSWSQWANYVLIELKRLCTVTDQIPALMKEIADLKQEIAMLKLKRSFYITLIGSIVTAGGGIIVAIIMKK